MEKLLGAFTPFVAQQPLPSHTHMGSGSAGLPPLQCGKCPEQPSQLMTQAQQEADSPAEPPDKPKPPSLGCEATVSILAVSCNLPRVQVTQGTFQQTASCAPLLPAVLREPLSLRQPT